MGLPPATPTAVPALFCTSKDTPCMPDLPIRYTKECVKLKTRAVLDGKELPADKKRMCKTMKDDLADCGKCPQLANHAQSQYAAFTGGCMSQLNAYHAASHPSAGIAA